MSAIKSRPRRTPKVPFKMRSIQNGDSNDSIEAERVGQTAVLSLASNGYEDISSDSNSSFDAAELEQVYGPPSEWGCGRCGRQVNQIPPSDWRVNPVRGQVADTEEGVQCDGPCRSWVHTQCGNISPSSYRRMVREEAEGRHSQWLCPGAATPHYTHQHRT